jgi:hypothetical protein
MRTPLKPVGPAPVGADKEADRPRKPSEKPACSEVVDPATGSPTIKFTAAPVSNGK